MEIDLTDINVGRMADEIRVAACQAGTEKDFRVAAEDTLR